MSAGADMVRLAGMPSHVDREALGIKYAEDVQPVGDKVTIEVLPRREIIAQLNKAIGEKGMERYRFARIAHVGPKARTDDGEGQVAGPGAVILVGVFCGEDMNGMANCPGWDQYWLADPRSDARVVRDTEIIAVIEDYDDADSLNGYGKKVS